MDLKPFIQDYLKQARLMQLATAVGNKPWCCSVWFAADPDLNIYWFSGKNRRHSDEVLKNAHVAGVIVLPQTPEEAPRGLQFEGVAEKLTDPADIETAKQFYVGRIFPSDKVESLITSPKNPHDFYRIRPTTFVLFDAVNFPDNTRQEYQLK